MGWWRNLKCKTEVMNFYTLFGNKELQSFIEDVIVIGNSKDWEVGGYYSGKTLNSWCYISGAAVTEKELIFSLDVLREIMVSGYLTCNNSKEDFLLHLSISNVAHKLKEVTTEDKYTQVLNSYLGVGGWD